MIQFLIPAADTVDIPTTQTQGFSPIRPSMPCWQIFLQRGRIWEQPERELAQIGGLVQMWGGCEWVPHMPWEGGCLGNRRSQWVSGCRGWGWVWEGCRGFSVFFLLGTAACLGPTVTFGADFVVLLFLVSVVSVLWISSWVGSRRNCSLDDMDSTDSVVPVRSQILLLVGRLLTFCLWGA